MAGGPIANLSATLRWDLDDFERGTARVSNVFKNIIGLAGDVAEAVGNMGKRLTASLTLPLGAIAVLTTKASSDAAELQSAFDVTFGSLSAGMNKWAEDTGDALGRSTQQMQQGAIAFGQLFNAAAPTEQAAARLSQKFTKLAVDAGSFFNVPFETAMQKIRSGLAGESEPLRDFGVFINEAAVKTKALELGLISSGQELDEYGKIMARQALIVEGLANANDDATRTWGSLANQIERIKANFKELSIEIGNLLAPYAQKLATIIERLIGWFKSLPESVKSAAVGFGVFLAALGPLSVILSAIVVTLLPAFLVGLGGVFPIISLIINPLGTLIVYAGKLFVGLGGLSSVLGKLAPMFLRLTGPVGLVISLLLMFKDEILAGVRTQMSAIAERVGPTLQRFFETLREASDRITAAFDELAKSPLGEALEWISQKVGELIQITAEMGGQLIGTVLSAVIELATGLIDYLGGAIETVVRLLSADWSGAWEAAVDTVSSAVIRIGQWIEGLFPVLGRALQMVGALSRAKLGGPKAEGGYENDEISPEDRKFLDNLADWTDGKGGGRNYAVAKPGPKPKTSRARKGPTGPSAEELADRREDLRLQQALAVAREKDDREAERALQRQIDLRSRIDAYKRAGLTKAQAATAAEKDMLELDQARAEAQAKARGLQQDRLDMQLAELRGDFKAIQVLEDKAFVEKRIAEMRAEGVDLAAAEEEAQLNLLHLEEARLERAQARATAEAEAHQIELARLRGDDAATIRRMEERQRIADRVFDLRSDRDNPMEAEDAMAQATREAMDRERAHMQGTFRGAFRDGLQAAMDGNLGQFFENWMKQHSFNALAKVLDRLADRLADLAFGGGESGSGGLGGIFGGLAGLFGGGGGASGSGTGGWMGGFAKGAAVFGGGNQGQAGGVLSLSGGLPKWANGGSGIIRGHPGIDKNLLSLNGNPIARVSSGELLNVQRNPANDGGGRSGPSRLEVVPSPYFDVVVDGRVMRSAPGIASAGAQVAQSNAAFRQSRRVPGR
ncbi:hypothetical protein [Novosphingopyxis sp. YJ-S2-01]|uniref:hypothetical protein n=1 Tax=Novosphingopyxis sp. YJ-S2-01 TaxID=2794021 RepID=UPI0018DD7B58|nr:hypothetical protein [Novosphingopyxis sp. YJ-S2-01]MBH9537530.1 hypothetical protein [Novosphingopyxis sp. YJ-S2-01]